MNNTKWKTKISSNPV